MPRSETYRLPSRTLLDKNGRAVPSGDPSGITVFGPAGKEIPMDLAIKLGLVSRKQAERTERGSFLKRFFAAAPADKAVRLEDDGKETK